MLKFIVFIFLVFCSFVTNIPPANAASVSLGSWHVTGSQMWRTSFPLDPNSNGASELYYPHSGNYITGSFETETGKNKSFRMDGGFMGNIRSGTGSDSDWNYQVGGNQLWYYGEFKTTGSAAYINLNWITHQNKNTSVFYGYSYNRNHYKMTDGIYYINNYQIESPPQQLFGLNSSYTMTYQGPHIGISTEKKVTPKISTVGSIKYSPIALAQGHGNWNLRNLEFNHTGSAQMLDTMAGVRFALSSSSSFTVGYRYQWCSLFKGQEDLNSDIRWDKATNIQKGIYFSGTTSF